MGSNVSNEFFPVGGEFDAGGRPQQRSTTPGATTSERTIETASGYAILTLSETGHIETWPESAFDLYEYSDEEIVGEPFATLWASESQIEDLDALLGRAHEQPVDSDAWHERSDGSVFWATTTVAPILNDEFHGYTVVVQNTTARKQYERMLEQQNDRLKEFTDILSHDLRNPLNVVDGRLDLYRETGDESHLEIIEDTTERMERLIDDLLSVARQGDVVTDPQPTDLEVVVWIAKQGTIPTSATLVLEPTPTVMADEDRLCELFENLFRNAVEHAGPEVTVRVGPLHDGFYVEDDGPGIPEDIRSEVFDHGFSTNERGTGFGLSVVRTIAGAHGWDVAVTASSTGGARFEITGMEPITV